MALRNSVTGEIRHSYSIEDLIDAANLMRGYDLVALHAAGSGHAGGTLSIMDITAALYLRVANHDPENPTCCWAVKIRPARMDAGIAANQHAFMHRKSVRIR